MCPGHPSKAVITVLADQAPMTSLRAPREPSPPKSVPRVWTFFQKAEHTDCNGQLYTKRRFLMARSHSKEIRNREADPRDLKRVAAGLDRLGNVLENCFRTD